MFYCRNFTKALLRLVVPRIFKVTIRKMNNYAGLMRQSRTCISILQQETNTWKFFLKFLLDCWQWWTPRDDRVWTVPDACCYDVERTVTKSDRRMLRLRNLKCFAGRSCRRESALATRLCSPDWYGDEIPCWQRKAGTARGTLFITRLVTDGGHGGVAEFCGRSLIPSRVDQSRRCMQHRLESTGNPCYEFIADVE